MTRFPRVPGDFALEDAPITWNFMRLVVPPTQKNTVLVVEMELVSGTSFEKLEMAASLKAGLKRPTWFRARSWLSILPVEE